MFSNLAVLISLKFRKATVLILLVFHVSTVFSQKNGAVEVSSDFKSISIGKYLEFLDDSLSSYSIERVHNLILRESSLWYTKNEDIPNFGNQKIPRWVHFSIKNMSDSGQDLILEISNSQINELKLFELNENGTYSVVGESGDKIPLSHRMIGHRKNLFAVDIELLSEKHFILFVKKDSALNLPVVLWSRNEYFPYDQKITLVEGVYFGLLLMIFIYALVLSISLKDLLYPIYGGYVFLLALTMFSIKGYGYQYIYSKYLWTAGFTVPDFGVIGSILFALFSIYFLELKKHNIKYFNVLKYYLIFYAIVYVIFRFTPGFTANNLMFVMKMYYVMFLTLILMSLTVGFIVFNQNRKMASIYLFSNIFMIGGIVLYTISEIGIIPLNSFTRNSMMIGSVFEMFILSLGIGYKIKQINEDKFKLLEIEAEHKTLVNRALVDGEQLERKRISEELHDGMGARLSIIKNQLINEVGTESSLIKELDNLSQEVREISHSLMPNLLDIMGLKSSLIDLFEKFSENTLFNVSFQDHDFPSELKIKNAHSIYRIVQEILNNIIKHANAEEVIIQMFGYEDEIQISIDDDGIGFDVKQITFGIGLNSIQGRADSIGANLIIDSEVGRGTSIILVKKMT